MKKLSELAFKKKRGGAEDELRETNARLQALIQAIPDMIIFKDTLGRHVLVNKALEDFTGRTREKIIGKSVEELLPTKLAEACKKSDEEVLSKRRCLHFEEKTAGIDGKEFFLDTIKAPLYDSKGELAGLVAVSRDITERKRSEERLRLFSEALAHKTSGLVRSNMELEHFASVVSHDLKAPLVSLGGFAELLQNKCGDQLDTKARGYLAHIIVLIPPLSRAC